MIQWDLLRRSRRSKIGGQKVKSGVGWMWVRHTSSSDNSFEDKTDENGTSVDSYELSFWDLLWVGNMKLLQ